MAKYRKKPIVIEAEVYREGLEDGFNCRGICCVEDSNCNDCGFSQPYIDTLGGKRFISPGDYIITCITGERYPCKPDIFEKTYEFVEE